MGGGVLQVAHNRVVVLADSSKIGHEDFAQIEHLNAIDILITDSNAQQELLASWKQQGLDVRVAEVG